MPNTVTREEFEALRVEHYVVEDCWYSCPLSGDSCNTKQKASGVCTCGADAHNARLDAVIAKLFPVPPSDHPPT